METVKNEGSSDAGGGASNSTNSLQSIRYVPANSSLEGKPSLQILDQLLLPFVTKYITICGTEDGWNCVKKMQVRGAPALAIVSMLSLAIEIQDPISKLYNDNEVSSFINLAGKKLNYLKTSRPTAVNLAEAAERLRVCLRTWSTLCITQVKQNLIEEIEKMLVIDVTTNRNIGAHGGAFLFDKAKTQNSKLNSDMKESLCVLTHCNTGSLATARYGTALGVARWLHSNKLLNTLFCTETRPYNQGARLSVYECIVDKIPYCLVTDSMVAALMASRKIHAVVVGADRVVANGDTANKIGTYQLAILARHFGVPFYVAAPLTTLDISISSGDKIVIEQRPASEFTSTARALPESIVWNPAFDVTPASLIDAIFTEHGVITKASIGSKCSGEYPVTYVLIFLYFVCITSSIHCFVRVSWT